jgi:hypothetical protein
LANYLRDATDDCSGVYKALAPIDVASSGAFTCSPTFYPLLQIPAAPCFNEGIEQSPLYLRGYRAREHAKEAAPLPLRTHEKRAGADRYPALRLASWATPRLASRRCLLERLVAIHLQRGLLLNRGTLQINKVVQEVH